MSMGMYNAILKWSLNQSDGFDKDDAEGDAPTAPTDGPSLGPMSAERKEFLARAMKQYIVNETERINDIVDILRFVAPPSADSSSPSATATTTATPSSSNYADVIKAAVDIKVDGGEPDIAAMLSVVPPSALADMKLAALQELRDRVEQVDNASFFACNCNGTGELELVLDLMLRHPSGRVRVAAGSVLSTVLQNNPVAQARAGDIPQFLQTLLATASTGGGNDGNDAVVAAPAAVAGPNSASATSLATGETAAEQAQLVLDLQTTAFSVLTCYVRGAATATAPRLALFLSRAVGGPEFLARVLRHSLPSDSNATADKDVVEWVRYTPAGKSKAREGWWRALPSSAAVAAGSEVAMDLSTGKQWLRYSGDGDPVASGNSSPSIGGHVSNTCISNPRLLSKVVFFLQFILRELARSKDSGASVAGLLHPRLDLAGRAGAMLVALAADVDPSAAAASEGAATALNLLLDLGRGSTATAGDSEGGSVEPNAASDVIINGGATALLALSNQASETTVIAPTGGFGEGAVSSTGGEGGATAVTDPVEEASEAPSSVAALQALFLQVHGPAVETACQAQEEALVASAGGDAEQLSYLEEPRALFKALLSKAREAAAEGPTRE